MLSSRNADQSESPAINQQLPDPLPVDPLPIFKGWLDEAFARKVQPNPNAMALATVGADGSPSVRTVLCKGVDLPRGFLVFYTNYNGRKGRELAGNPRAAVCFHWDNLDRQVRLEGPVTQSPAAESDGYFVSRPLESRLGAWSSDQSEPIESRNALLEKAELVRERFGTARQIAEGSIVVPRPPHWGGYRLWPERVELWVGGVGRMHDRAGWVRELRATQVDGAPGFMPVPPGRWSATRLQP